MLFIKDKDLKKFILDEIESDRHPDFYDPDGNSPRAILSRRNESYFKSLVWSTKDLASDAKFFIKGASMDTSIGNIINFILILIFLPASPFIKEHLEVKDAIECY